MWFVWVVVLAGAYLLGSIPTAYLLVKLKMGLDIRKYGSGNVGSTNSVRVAGKTVGLAVFLIDVAKGLVPVYVAKLIGGEAMAACAGMLALVGHMHPLWLGFRGGKGVATSLGIALALVPWIGMSAFVLWLVIAISTGYVSLASCISIFMAAVACLLSGQPWMYTLLFFLITALVTIRHRSNIQNLAAGTERKSFRKKK